MGKRYYVKSQTEEYVIKYDVERKCPLGWYTEVEVEGTSIIVTFWYVPHNKIDDRSLKKYNMSFTLDKEELLKTIPEEYLNNKFLLCSYTSKMNKKSKELGAHIRNSLADDFEELQSSSKSTAEMYSTILKIFGESAKYQHLLKRLAKFIALDSMLSKYMPSEEDIYKCYELSS